MSKVGIITYHSAYNFGSVLQAFATQKIIEQLGYNAYIINYRMKSQREFYSLYRTNYGIKTFIKDILLYPRQKERFIRAQRFENVISRMNLTDEITEPEEATIYSELFDCFISGSDQIWNKHSCELSTVGWEYMTPYLLGFTNKKKISYGSSLANMTDKEIEKILPFLKEFNFLSFREPISAQKVSNMLGKETVNVLDPTMLFTEHEWLNWFNFECKDKSGYQKYIFFYSLAGYKDVNPFIEVISRFAMDLNLKVFAVTPFLFYKDRDNIRFIYDAGPEEFLYYIRNAELVITDSYHGTLFSINFNKNFFSITDGTFSNMRKNQILDLLKLNDRIVVNANEIPLKSIKTSFKEANKIIDYERQKSVNYLSSAIKF